MYICVETVLFVMVAFWSITPWVVTSKVVVYHSIIKVLSCPEVHQINLSIGVHKVAKVRVPVDDFLGVAVLKKLCTLLEPVKNYSLGDHSMFLAEQSVNLFI